MRFARSITGVSRAMLGSTAVVAPSLGVIPLAGSPVTARLMPGRALLKMEFPKTRLPEELKLINTPSAVLPAMMFFESALVPPMTWLMPETISMPFELPRERVAEASRPMILPVTRTEFPFSKTPEDPLDEITLPAPPAVPPSELPLFMVNWTP